MTTTSDENASGLCVVLLDLSTVGSEGSQDTRPVLH